MQERRLGPVVGLGTWNTFDGDAGLARQVVSAAFEAGTRLFDSSPMYHGAEAALGAALAGLRNDAIVATKIWASSLAEGREQFARQLEWYGGRVDVEQIHNLLLWQEHVEWLRAEQDADRIGKLGVTHYQASAFGRLADALRTNAFQVLQIPYNPWERECERELLPLAACVASWPEALLRWALGDERIDSVIPATKSPERARANARAGEGPRFTPEQRALVEQLAQ
jgi:diketogulonate reductase-like aldo/keto reductase